jgi:hypothetical protein
MKAKGWTKTCWKSLFSHVKTNSLMIVYVDDFRMAAKPEFTPRLWGELREVLHLDEPEPPGKFLGCYQHYFTSAVKRLSLILSANPRVRLRREKPVEKVFEDPNHEVRGYSYDRTQYLEKAVDKFLALTGAERKALRKAETPFIDESKDLQGCIPMDSTLRENQVRAELAKQACSTIMTLMFCARLARHELLRACGGLATFLHKWTALTDKKLWR